jgi:hypothetical protein
MKTKHEKRIRIRMKSQEINKVSKSSQTKKKRSNLSDEKLKEDKIEKTFQFEVIFQNKTSKT